MRAQTSVLNESEKALAVVVRIRVIGPDGKVRRTSGDLFFAEVRPFDEKGYGNYVIIEWPGFYVLLAHLERIDVVADREIWMGERVGVLGSTGNSTGPHVHMGLRATGEHKDFSGWKGWLNPVPFRYGAI